MADDNDPLAGVPAVDWSSCFDAWWEVYHESPPHVVGDLPATALEHIQWERQQRLKAEASLATAQRVSQIAVSESTAVADAVLAGVADAAVQKLVELKSQLKQVEADAAAMREALSASLRVAWLWTERIVTALDVNGMPPQVLVEPHEIQAQAALSGSAGVALLAERDLLLARVERLRRALKQAASADHGGEGWAVGGYNLEPGDLEEGDQA